jgi:hypothetical protein
MLLLAADLKAMYVVIGYKVCVEVIAKDFVAGVLETDVIDDICVVATIDLKSHIF